MKLCKFKVGDIIQNPIQQSLILLITEIRLNNYEFVVLWHLNAFNYGYGPGSVLYQPHAWIEDNFTCINSK
jgi:hypothetical protein